MFACLLGGAFSAAIDPQNGNSNIESEKPVETDAEQRSGYLPPMPPHLPVVETVGNVPYAPIPDIGNEG